MIKKVLRKIKFLYVYLTNRYNDRDEKVWVFTEWFGKKCCDNAAFLANYIADRETDIVLYWIAEKETDCSFLNSQIKVVEKDTTEAIEIMKRAKVVLMNQGVEEFTSSRLNYFGNALKVNLWHGVIWKKLGYDSVSKLCFVRKIFDRIGRTFDKRYLYISPSDKFREIVKTAFEWRDNQIFNCGQPRNALFFDDSKLLSSRKEIEKLLNHKTDVQVDSETVIITYMPTFRDKKEDVFDFNNFERLEALNDFLEKKNAIIVQKKHFISCERDASKKCENRRIITDGDLFAQKLLASTDLLITDYSSCFFDFLLLDRPIIHYLYDYDYYSNEDRGLYFSYDCVVGGDVVWKEEELIKYIQKNIEHPEENQKLRKQRIKEFQTYESENSCEFIFEEILRRIKG